MYSKNLKLQAFWGKWLVIARNSTLSRSYCGDFQNRVYRRSIEQVLEECCAVRMLSRCRKGMSCNHRLGTEEEKARVGEEEEKLQIAPSGSAAPDLIA